MTTLLNQNEKVIGIDRDKSGEFRLPKHDDFEMVWDDLIYINNYDFDVDTIYHLASAADTQKSLTNTYMDLRDGVEITHKVLEYMRINDIKKLIYSSSSAVYGEMVELPTPENTRFIKPISLYGAQKAACEMFIHAYCDLYGIKSWIFRFANVTGHGVHRGVIYDFYHKLRKDSKELLILGDGKQRKSYFDVQDCVDGLVDIPKFKNADDKRQVKVYNLGNTETMDVVELTDIVCKEFDVKPKYKFTGEDRGWQGEAPITILDIKEALATGWKPKFTQEEAIKNAVRYVRETF